MEKGRIQGLPESDVEPRPQADHPPHSPSAQGGWVWQPMGIFEVRSRLLPTAVLHALRGLLPAMVAVVALRGRPGGQDGKRLPAGPTPSPPNQDEVMQVIVCWFAPLPVADDRTFTASRTQARQQA